MYKIILLNTYWTVSFLEQRNYFISIIGSSFKSKKIFIDAVKNGWTLFSLYTANASNKHHFHEIHGPAPRPLLFRIKIQYFLPLYSVSEQFTSAHSLAFIGAYAGSNRSYSAFRRLFRRNNGYFNGKNRRAGKSGQTVAQMRLDAR